MNDRSIIASLAAALTLAACSTLGNRSSVGIFGAPPVAAVTRQSTGKAATLLIANAFNVTIYNGQTGSFKKKIDNGEPDLRSLFVTSKGEVIVGRPQGSLVTIYGVPRMRELQKIAVPHPLDMASDADGNLFVLSERKGKRVEVFAPGSSLPYHPTPVRTISSGVNSAETIAVDTVGDLYVPNCGDNRGKNVTVYAPGSSTPTQTITQGILGPCTIALDAANNIYVGNEGPSTANEHGSVTVYAAGTTTLTNTITSGIEYPQSLAFNVSGDLYVGNYGLTNQNVGDVTAYAPKHFSLIRRITSGIHNPYGIVLDGAGTLFVANDYFNSSYNGAVTVYSPSSDTPTQTITENVRVPSSVSILR